MPLYEYECERCSIRFEVIQKFSDPPVDKCRSCGGPVRRLLSAPAIQFKGTGWYITDYARKGRTDAGSSTASSPSTGPSSAAPAADKGSGESASTGSATSGESKKS